MSIRRLVFIGAGAAAALLIAGPASAAPGVSSPSASDLSSARQVSAAPANLTQVNRFFASTGTSLVAPNAQVQGDPVAVYTLNAAFVKSAGAPVATLEFLTSTVSSGDGRTASVSTARTGTGWSVVNIATGSEERDMALAGAGGTVFQEPQIHAWYVLRGDVVAPLNGDARTSVGSGVSLAAYQKLVHGRYADKLPGSAYDRAGLAGGFDTAVTPASASATNYLPWLLVAGVFAVALFGVPRLRRH